MLDPGAYRKDGSAPGRVFVSMTPLVDAYALGALLRLLLTGVPPERNVMQFITQQAASPAEWVSQLVRACSGRPVRHYRYLSEVPGHVVELLNRLMDHNPRTRMSVAQLGASLWIAEAPGAGALPFNRSAASRRHSRRGSAEPEVKAPPQAGQGQVHV